MELIHIRVKYQQTQIQEGWKDYDCGHTCNPCDKYKLFKWVSSHNLYLELIYDLKNRLNDFKHLRSITHARTILSVLEPTYKDYCTGSFTTLSFNLFSNKVLQYNWLSYY
jgi:hypothetical protein